jgi:hypothetical protein
MPAHKSKSIATWLAVLLGGFGAHRFYLHGFKDVWGWLHVPGMLAGMAGVIRMSNLGQDDKAAWVLVPIGGLVLAAAMLHAIVIGLTADERWNAKHNVGVESPPQTRWAPVIGVVLALLLGATALMSTIAFSGQKFFEWQVEEARKLSQ